MHESSHLLTPETKPVWKQPVGAWRERGASKALLRVGLGLPLDFQGEDLVDEAGFTPWHYWAHSPQAHHSFDRLLQQVGDTLLDRIAASGEHAWHFLLLDGNLEALEAWKKSQGAPKEPPAIRPSGDTFSHCLAWSGDGRLWALFEKQDLASINAPDAQSITPLVIAIHRGDYAFARAFLMAGADPQAIDQQGRTALHHAAQYGDQALFMLLEDMGGDPEQRDNNGIEAQSILRARRQVSSSDISALREHWARRRWLRTAF